MLMLEHAGRQPGDEIGRVFVDRVGKVHRARGERGHVRRKMQHAAPLLRLAAAAAGRELDDDSGTAPADAVLECGETGGIGTGVLVLIADMDMDERGACRKSLGSRFDLLGNGTGRAGLSFLRGTDPVMATVMMQGSS